MCRTKYLFPVVREMVVCLKVSPVKLQTVMIVHAPVRSKHILACDFGNYPYTICDKLYL